MYPAHYVEQHDPSMHPAIMYRTPRSL
ncbi:hypothetical protein Tco_0623649, partial [Tanacetum coccineum]